MSDHDPDKVFPGSSAQVVEVRAGRALRRFGREVHVIGRMFGSDKLCIMMPDGQWYTPDPNTVVEGDVQPTYYFDDITWDKLREQMLGEPGPEESPTVVRILQDSVDDARKVRDQTLGVLLRTVVPET